MGGGGGTVNVQELKEWSVEISGDPHDSGLPQELRSTMETAKRG